MYIKLHDHNNHKIDYTTGYLNQMRFSWAYSFLHGRVLKLSNVSTLHK